MTQEHVDASIDQAGTDEPKRRGPKPGTRRVTDEDKVVNPGIALPGKMVAYFQTWHDGGTISEALREVYGDLKKIRPAGRFSAVQLTPEQRAAALSNPNSKPQLKKRVRQLEAEVEGLRGELARLRAVEAGPR